MSLCLLGVEAGSDQTNDLFVSLNPSTDAAASNELASPVTVESPSRTNTVDVLTLDQSTAPALDLPAPKKDADSEYEDEFDDELVSPVSDGPLHSQSLPSGQPSTQKTSLEMVKGVADGIKQVIDVAVANTSEVLSRPRSGASGSSRDGNPTNPSSAIASTAAVEAVKPFHSAYIVLGGTRE